MTTVRDLEFYSNGIKERKIDLENMYEVIQEVELNTENINSEIKVREETLLQEAKAEYESLGKELDEAHIKLSAAKAVLADRKSVLRELKDNSYWADGSYGVKESVPISASSVSVEVEEESFTGTSINIGGHYFLIERPLKGRVLTPIINALKSISKEEALNIIDNNLLDYITDKSYQRIKKKLGLEGIVLSEEEEVDIEYEAVQDKESCDKKYGPNGEELPF